MASLEISWRALGWRYPRVQSATVGVALACVVTALSIVMSTSAAHAEDKNAARDHWERGTKYYDIGKYDEAIKEFEAAYEAKTDPAFLYNLAQSHRLAGHTNEALKLYRTYLRYVPKAPNRADIEARINELEKAASARPATDPTVPVTPPSVSGGAATAPPPPTTTPPLGTGTTPPGSSWPPPGGTTPGTEPYGAPTQPPPAGGYPAPPPVDPASSEPSADGSGRRKIAMIVGGSGVGVIVIGAIFGGVAKSQSSKVESTAAARGAFDPSVESWGQTAEVLQWVGYGLGFAAVATGVILYATAPSGETSATPPPVALAPLAGPGLGGALLRVTF
jgi:tetratricopeptide (TPR) repeat protein